MECYAVCSPGLEPWTARELRTLGFSPSNTMTTDGTIATMNEGETGGVTFDCTLKDLPHANNGLRTATRVLVRLARFNASKFVELRRKTGNLPWEDYLAPGQGVIVRASAHHSRLYHSGAVSNEIITAITHRLGTAQPATDEGSQLVFARLVNDVCTISLDSSGNPLYLRGYRLATAKAPLRESLAAGIVMASGWDGILPLVDPFCGAGTIPIEAALMACNSNPRSLSGFAFQSWRVFQAQQHSDTESLSERCKSGSNPVILASDRDNGAVRMATENATRAGVENLITFTRQPLSDACPPAEAGWVVTNPPYGQRVSHGLELRNLYAQIGNVMRRSFLGWRFAILCNDRALIGHTGLAVANIFPFSNGGIRVHLYCGQVI